jgi:excisionase family DNA binding protein
MRLYSMDNEEVKPNAVYTTKETQDLLKISTSTMKRLLKKGIIRANKVGGQYRILGREVLRLVSPALEQKAIDVYMDVKEKVRDTIKEW